MQIRDALPRQSSPAIGEYYRTCARTGMIATARVRRAAYDVYDDFDASWGCYGLMTVDDGIEHYRLDDRRVTLDENAFLLVGPRTRYSYRLETDRPARIMTMAIPTATVSAAARDLGGDPSSAEDEDLARQSIWLRSRDGALARRFARIMDAAASGHRDTLWYQQEVERLIATLLIETRSIAERWQLQRRSVGAPDGDTARRMSRVVEYLHAHYADSLDLATLAAVACYSRYHFLRVFSAWHGTTPHAYLTRLRVTAAARHLERDERAVAEVGAAVGLPDRATFARQFRRHFGVSPRDYRRGYCDSPF